MSYTPRHLRRGYTDNSGSGDKNKSLAFRRAKGRSDQFIHQSASYLEKHSKEYAAYCHKTDKGSLRT